MRRDMAEHVPGSIGVVFELKKCARGEGFFVQEVMPYGAAAASGQVAAGDRLLQVDGTPIGTSSGTTLCPHSPLLHLYTIRNLGFSSPSVLHYLR